jgi:hypothetical protein
MASRASLIQSRSIYVGTLNSVAPSDGNLIVTGDVGIGTTAPLYKLHVDDNNSYGGIFIEGDNAPGLSIRDNSGTSLSIIYVQSTAGSQGNLRISSDDNNTATTPTIEFLIGGSEKMRILDDGNVGIGTTNPSEKLHIDGRLRVATIDNGSGDFATISGTGVITRRTAAQVLTDIGAQSALTNPVTGTGTTNYVPKWTGASALGDSLMVSNSTGIGIGISNPTNRLYVQGQDSNNLYDNIIGVFRGAGTGTSNTAEVYIQNDAYDTLVLGSIGSNYSGSSWAGARYIYAATGDLMIKTLDPSTNLRFYTAGAANERMRITSAGNVGIGTTNPAQKLHVAGNGLYTGNLDVGHGVSTGDAAINLGTGRTGNGFAYIDLIGDTTYTDYGLRILRNNGGANTSSLIVHRGTGDFSIQNNEAANLTFLTAAAERMRITSTGNVGIGTTSPSFKTTISADITKSGDINPGTAQLSLEGATTPGKRMILGYDTNSNGFGFIKAGNYGVTWTPLSLQPDGGNVGIGTTSPGYKLEVYGSVMLGGTDAENYIIRLGKQANSVYMGGPNTNTINVGYDENQVYNLHLNYLGYQASTTQYRNLIVNDGRQGEIARFVGSSAFVGIGNSAPSYKLDVTGDVRITSGSLGVGVVPNATDGRIDASNDIVAFSTSDERFKENITPIANALEKVKTLTGVEFDWRKETKDYHGYVGHDVGVIAQQVKAVLPEAVRTNANGYLAVRYEKIIGLLIEANKELAARVEELESKLK